MTLLVQVLRAVFLGNLLFSVVLSIYILSGYVKRAFSGDPEARWLGRHIAPIALAHLLLLGWPTARFFVAGHTWSWGWTTCLAAIFGLSDFGLIQLNLYRRWRDARRKKGST